MRSYAINCCSKKLFQYRYPTKRIVLCNQAYKVLFGFSGKRCLTTVPRGVTRVAGLITEEEEKLSYNVVVPEKFNFASDVIDKWAEKERKGLRSNSVPAFWYVSDDGKEQKYTYEQLANKTKNFAHIFEHQLGFKHGDYTFVLLPKIAEFWLVNISLIRVGSVFAPNTMMCTLKDLEYRFQVLKPSNIIAHDSVTDLVDEASKSISSLKNKIVVSEKQIRKPGWFDLNHFQSDVTNHKCASTRGDETMMIYFTSGTTGQPKMVEHTHISFSFSIADYGKYGLDLTPKNTVWSMADTGWSFTAYNFFGTWSMGACLFIHELPKFCPKKTLEILSEYPIDTLASAPLVYNALLNEKLEEKKFKTLEYCIAGGDALSKELAEQWYSKTGILLHNGFGQSETTALVASRKCFEYRFGSMGKPAPGITVTVVDENENVVSSGVIGEMVVERKTFIELFKGYKNNPEATKAVLTEKYYHSGDLVYYDEDGYFWYVGRKDDVINSAGYRIGPTEVEEAIVEHPAVAEAACVGSPDPERGEVVKAFIVLNSSAKPSEELMKEIQDHCKRTTAPYKYPRKIEFVTELPKGPSGKVKRSVLKKREKELAQKN